MTKPKRRFTSARIPICFLVVSSAVSGTSQPLRGINGSSPSSSSSSAAAAATTTSTSLPWTLEHLASDISRMTELLDPVTPDSVDYAHPDAATKARWTRDGLLGPNGGKPSHTPDSAILNGKLRGAVDRLRYEQFLDPRCHTVAHQIGYDLYFEVDQKLLTAVELCEYRCTGGCLHGVLKAHMQMHRKHLLDQGLNGGSEATMSGHAVDGGDHAGNERGSPAQQGSSSFLGHANALSTAAASSPAPSFDDPLARELWKLTTDENILAFATPGEVAHAVGHGLVLSGLSVAEALELCHVALGRAESSVPASLSHYCAGGVMMESMFEAKPSTPDSLYHISRRSIREAAEVCAAMPSHAWASCFYYANRRSWKTCVRCASDGKSCLDSDNHRAGDCPRKNEDSVRLMREQRWVMTQTTEALRGMCLSFLSPETTAGPQRIGGEEEEREEAMDKEMLSEFRRRRALAASCIYGVASGPTYDSYCRYHGGHERVAVCDGLVDTVLKAACIDGLAFRAGKFWPNDLKQSVCGELAEEDERELCHVITGTGMYSMAKEALMREYS